MSRAHPAEEFRAQVIARVSVVVFRSAMIRYRELRARGGSAPPGVEQLLGDAFAMSQ